MHFCPDCGEECDCVGDLDTDCEHFCETLEEKSYQEDYYDPFEHDDEFYNEDCK